MKRLYVGNVNFNATPEDVREEFAKYGVVTDVKFMTDRETGQFRGFAFVSYENKDDADRAILALDGQLFMGRPLRVNEAEDHRPNGNGGGNNYRPSSTTARIYVGNINRHATLEDVREEFAKYGVVTDVKFMTDRETGQFRGFAFVSYETKDDANRAILAMDGQLFMERPLKVSEAEDRRPNGNGGNNYRSAPQGNYAPRVNVPQGNYAPSQNAFPQGEPPSKGRAPSKGRKKNRGGRNDFDRGYDE